MIALMFTGFPRSFSALTVAGILLLSRRMNTRSMLGMIDWHLITLFRGLFIVVSGFNASGLPEKILDMMFEKGFSLENPYFLSVFSIFLSNVVSNVPATTLIGPHIPANAPASIWYVLSLFTTYAGNLLTIGSMANLIVIEQARLSGVRISFGEYARAGVWVTLANMGILMGWIWMKSLI